ncbi:hypothetical protein [Hyphomicrobium sp. LHD-15]|uniref:hypothetical protein n=1 Tax=Hyphomicrobium sp. LHD-15 TaxID=3072142 RepID=UPI00280C44AA|nr:hypothetical protein [Hyphomicrobium sp. LHD-15]MDQ8700653.1 hypothetical protein [Hyphomicrobium sp. LHD-15]
MIKFIGSELRRYYGAIVKSPMPWPVIDKLSSLEEVEEKSTPPDQADGGGERDRSAER